MEQTYLHCTEPTPWALAPATERSRWIGVRCLAAALVLCGSMLNAQAGCEGATWVNYAYDYRQPKNGHLIRDIEVNHFPKSVENLTKPRWKYFGSDIQYLLERVPNHPRALATMARLVERDGMDQPDGATVPIECQFQRAFLFARDDLLPRLIYADFLGRRKMRSDALRQLAYIVKQAGESEVTHFNAGLIYMDLKCYGLALKQAHRAMALGLTRPMLRERLVEAKQWRDPTEQELASWVDGVDPTPGDDGQKDPECSIDKGTP